MPQMFISHTVADTPLAERIALEARIAGFTAITYPSLDQSIRNLNETIIDSDFVLVLVTKDWLRPDYNYVDLLTALSNQRTTFLIVQEGIAWLQTLFKNELEDIPHIFFNVDEDLTTIAQRVVSTIIPKQSAAKPEPVGDEETNVPKQSAAELEPVRDEETAWFGAHVLGDFEPKLPALDDKDIAPSQPPRAVPASPIPPPQASGSTVGREISATSIGLATSNVSFTAFYPNAVTPNRTYALVVSAHIADAVADVRKAVEPYLEQLGGTPKESTAASSQAVAPNALLTFIPLVAGVVFQPADQVIVWQPPYKTSAFLFNIPEGYPAREIMGSVKVFSGPIKVGEIALSMHIESQSAREPLSNIHEERMEPYRKIFASYSHRDTPVVEYFREYRKSVGDHLLVDRHELRSGDDWEKRIMEMIDNSDSFQLFWSRNSAASKYCRQEWERALAKRAQRPNFIQPVYWTRPLDPAPPLTLNSIHFAPVTLPPLTRMQMALGTLRRWTGR